MYPLKKHLTPCVLIVVALSLSSSGAFAVGMVPELPVLLVDEALGEATINVKNTDSHPSLLYTVIENTPQDTESLVVLSPPLARVEPGATQQVRVILQSARPLETERLKRVIFEGIQPATEGQAQIQLGVRQNIPMIVRPANLPVEREPWKRLNWSLHDGKVSVTNPSPYVVRLSKSVNLMPAGMTLDLQRTYILPGEDLALTGDVVPASSTTVQLFPATTYGFAVGSHDAPLVGR